MGHRREINGFSSNFLLSCLDVIAALVDRLGFVQKQQCAHRILLNLKNNFCVTFCDLYHSDR